MLKTMTVRITIATFLAGLSMSAHAIADTQRIDIPAGSLLTALETLAKQANVDLVYQDAQIKGLRTGGVAGELSSHDAVVKLLQGTPLKVRRDEASGAILITIPPASAPAASSLSPTPFPQSGEGQGEQPKSFWSRLRLAQADTSSPSQGEGRGGDRQQAAGDQKVEDPAQSQKRIELEEIIVTGTNIRGLRNPTAPALSFNRDDIDRSGYGTTQEFMASLPQDFGGGDAGASEDGVVGPGVSAQLNQEAASGVNLRGLGTSSTLVLLNGRRMAPAAFGGITDISVIPLAAIERVDVVTDGSSAIYGGDAVAGVVNFVLRRDYQGAETRVSYGGVTDGSMRRTIASQTLGGVWDSGGLVATLQYQDQTKLLSSERDFTASTPQPTDLTPHSTKYGFLLAGHDQITANIDVFGDALVSDQDLDRRLRASATSLREFEVSSLQESYNLGLGFEGLSDWRLELRGAFGRQTTEFVYNVVQPPIANYTPGERASRNLAEVSSLDANADGSLLTLPGGMARMALGAGRREESFESLVPFLPAGPQRLRASERTVSSAYGELYVPIVGEANAFGLARRLDLSLAARWDDYSDLGATTNPKVALVWTPLEGLDVRASWSTSFRAPIANELLNQAQGTAVFNNQMPAPGGGVARVLAVSGVDPDLGPEESESWTLGLDYRPPAFENLRLTFIYYDIHFKGRIIQPPFNATLLSQPDVYGSLVTPLADDAAAAAFLADQIAQGATFTDFFGFGTTGVRYALNVQTQNTAFVDQTGYDIGAQYGFESAGNRFDVSLNGSIIDEIITGFTPKSLPADVVDTYGNPLSLRLRAVLGWSRGAWRANAAINYRGDYTDTSASPAGKADAWITTDLHFGYALGGQADSGSPLSGVLLALNVSNAFDESPPYVAGGGRQPGIHYDAANADPFGRTVSFEIRKRW